jgi:TonB family protein
VVKFWTQPVSRGVTFLACTASAAIHAFVLIVVVPTGLQPAKAELERLLPALYLIAPNRQPHIPRQVHLVGIPIGNIEQPEKKTGDDGAPALPKSPFLEGMMPAGIPEMALDSVFSVLDVDSQVVRYASSAAPDYPPSLLKAGIEGAVESEFVVDTTGIVDLTSVRILFATDPAFTRSVQDALYDMRFRPAIRGSQKVRQLVHQRFTFQIRLPPQPGDPAS